MSKLECRQDFDTFRHIHSPWHRDVGSVTLAFSKRGTAIGIGCSVCSPKDNFCKQTGREQAYTMREELVAEDADVLLQHLTLNELAFYVIRAQLPELPESHGKDRWRKALGILAWELDLNDFNRGEKVNWV